jgi:hypothetical protein
MPQSDDNDEATELDEKETPLDKCDPDCDATPRPSGPPREAGGTIGSGNLSPGQASRTGGATTGVPGAGAGAPGTVEDRAKDRGVAPSA